MTSEEIEAGTMRGFLGTAFGDAEPPLRDLASGSIARGDGARRRIRWYTAGGAALSAAAVVGTFAVTTAGSAGHKPVPAAASTSKPTPTPTPAAKKSAGSPEQAAQSKQQDMYLRFPAALQPLLPSGTTVQVEPPGYSNLSETDFLLTRSSGTTLLAGSAAKPGWPASNDKTIGCLQKGGCEVHKVAGGTVYVNENDAKAAEQVGAFPKGTLRPGTENLVVLKDVWLTYIPDDRSQRYLQFREATSVAPMPYAASAPVGWKDAENGTWPPPQLATGPMRTAYDPQGVAISVDEFAALAVAPNAGAVLNLLDREVPASPEAVTAQQDRAARISALMAPALPKGVTADQDGLMQGHGMALLSLTGPTGTHNKLQVSTDQQSAAVLASIQNCPAGVHCENRKVPGGRILLWAQASTDSDLHPLSDKPNSFQYTFFPDDTGKPLVRFDLMTDGTTKGSVVDPIVSLDQFQTAVANPHLADIVNQVVTVLQ